MEAPRLILKPREDGRLRGGHLWAFSNELAQVPSGVDAGAVADLIDARGRFLARGYFNPHSLIAFRVLAPGPEAINAAFFEARLRAARALRETLYPGCRSYRWVYGESDGLPGLLVDRFNDVAVVQAVSAGMERAQDELAAALMRAGALKGVLWRRDSSLRALEGLPVEAPRIAAGSVPETLRIETENGIFHVDLMKGQKTGFYFDQRDNRQAASAFAKGKKALDAFCYSGAFGVAAARAGAREVVFADSAHAALEWVDRNVEANDLRVPVTLIEGDVLDLLSRPAPGGPFEWISIDPPAYAKSKKHLPQALKAYEKLNLAAIKAVASGGFVVTSSCSHHVTRELFDAVIGNAASKSGRRVRIVERRGQAKDHPVLPAMPETEYLKCAILHVV